MEIKFTSEHESQLDGLIDETILPALDEDFDLGIEEEADGEEEEREELEQIYKWKQKAIKYLIAKLKLRIGHKGGI